jgi:uncharacterized protein (DUF2236 family)
VSDFFPQDSVIRRVNGEPAIMLGAGRALLLQVAHPKVAQAVADHSNFRDDPFRRLQATAEAMYSVVFGSADLALAVGAHVKRVHESITGPGYRASDPENLRWVHATLCDSAAGAYRRFVGNLSARDAETYWQEMQRVGAVFGIPAQSMPATWLEFREYFKDTTSALRVSPVSRDLAVDIVDPPLPFPARTALLPATALHRFVAVGTLPRAIRTQLGFQWRPPQQRALDAFAQTVRAGSRVTPTRVRVGPGALAGQLFMRHARRHVAPALARSM